MNLKLHLKPSLLRTARRYGVTEPHDAEAIVDDALWDESAIGYEHRKVMQKSIDYVRKKHLEIELYLDAPVGDELTNEPLSGHDVQPNSYENEIKAEMQARQRQLIEQLALDSDERTTEIVRTWLESDKPTTTNVAKRLGLDHKQVSRCLKRLSNKFSESNFGFVSDYLSA